MGVLLSNREVCTLEAYNNAEKLCSAATRFVMNERNVPKRYRPIYTFKLREKCEELLEYIELANSIQPKNIGEAMMRREYQSKALAMTTTIDRLLRDMLFTLHIPEDRFEEMAKLLHKEINLLNGWRRSDSNMIARLIEESNDYKIKKVKNIIREIAQEVCEDSNRALSSEDVTLLIMRLLKEIKEYIANEYMFKT